MLSNITGYHKDGWCSTFAAFDAEGVGSLTLRAFLPQREGQAPSKTVTVFLGGERRRFILPRGQVSQIGPIALPPGHARVVFETSEPEATDAREQRSLAFLVTRIIADDKEVPGADCNPAGDWQVY